MKKKKKSHLELTYQERQQMKKEITKFFKAINFFSKCIGSPVIAEVTLTPTKIDDNSPWLCYENES